MKEKKFEHILRDKLYDLNPEQNVPGWEEMQRRMAISAQAEADVQRRSSQRWIYIAAAAMVVLILALGSYLVLRSEQNPLPAGQLLSSTAPDKTLPVIDFNQPITIAEEISEEPHSVLTRLAQSARSVTTVTSPQLNPLLSSNAEPTVLEGFDIQIAAESLFTEEQVKQQQSVTADYTPHRNNTVRAHGTASGAGGGFNWDRFSDRNQVRNWQVSAFTSAFASSDKGSGNGSNLFPLMSYVASMVESNYRMNASMLSEIKLKHAFPISVGMSVKHQFNGRWGLETGLVYSYLESNGDIGGVVDLYTRRQQVHYLGIPLYASYSLFNNDKWDIYLNGGFMAEMALSSQQRTRMYYENQLVATDNRRLDARGVLWSTTFGGGVSYYMVDNFGVYLEPGASYYFRNDRQPTTYRTDNPWSFNLRLGFRYRF